jgi:hypothetical protein
MAAVRARAMGVALAITGVAALAACGVSGTTPICGPDAGCGPPANEGGVDVSIGGDAGPSDAARDTSATGPADAGADARDGSTDAPPG